MGEDEWKFVNIGIGGNDIVSPLTYWSFAVSMMSELIMTV